VLILAGAHDPVTRPEWAREVADSLPPGRWELVEFADASHLIMADEPYRFAEAVRGFIAAR
jgi:pimeloyl-ACP methyl ester carboxylesterase